MSPFLIGPTSRFLANRYPGQRNLSRPSRQYYVHHIMFDWPERLLDSFDEVFRFPSTRIADEPGPLGMAALANLQTDQLRRVPELCHKAITEAM